MSGDAGSEFATKYDLNNLDKRLTKEINDDRERINGQSRAISRLEAVYASLAGLPDAIANLDKTTTVIGANLELMNKNIEEVKKSVSEQQQSINNISAENIKQDEDINRIDNKSKIDWAVFITNNFWKIFALGTAAYVIIRFAIDKV